MPAVLESRPAQLPADARRKLTRQDCRALAEAGLLEGERFELIDGELIRKMPKSRLHSLVLLRLVACLRNIFGQWHVEQEVSINLSAALDATNEPEPDAVVLRRPSADFPSDNPGPVDILLVAEVSVTTREYDLGAKAALYASAGINEYWVLDLPEARIVVHRHPDGDRYSSIVAYAVDEPVTPLAAESASIQLQDLVN